MRRILLSAALVLCAVSTLFAQQTDLSAAEAALTSSWKSLGLVETDVTDYRVSDSYTSASGITHVYFQQTYAGIDVHNAIFNASSINGETIHSGSSFVRNVAGRATATSPSLTPEAAVRTALLSEGLSPGNLESQARQTNAFDVLDDAAVGRERTAELAFLETDSGVHLVWRVSLAHDDPDSHPMVFVDATDGSLHGRVELVISDNWGPPSPVSPAVSFDSPVDLRGVALQGPATQEFEEARVPNSYLVYPWPIEAPHNASPAPPGDARTLETAPWDLTSSPFGWHDTNGAAGAEFTRTRGNNVDAYSDSNNTNSGTGPDCGADLSCEFPINLAGSPSSYSDAAVANLFYWNNLIHDVWYNYGFTEVAGNFQANNYGNGGVGNDWVRAEAQDGSGTCNANMFTQNDGTPPRMQMYTCGNANPTRDGDLDNAVIVHEYGHGISIRLVGGPNNSSCLNNFEQAGEGWSDYFGLLMTMEPGDAGTDARGIGTWLFGQPPTGGGIRPDPYTTNTGINPSTYSRINSVSVPHGVGFVWATTMWDMTWYLVDQFGFDPDIANGTGGNNLAMKLVIDGLAMTPCSPSQLQVRDAYIAAIEAHNASGSSQQVSVCGAWDVFAERGYGSDATPGGNNGFEVPEACQAALIVNRTADKSSAAPGESVTFSVSARNQTNQSLSSVELTDELPTGLEFVTGSADCPANVSGQTVTLTAGSLSNLGEKVCSYRARVDPGLTASVQFTDDMESGVTNWSSSFDPTETSNSWTQVTTDANSGSTSWFAPDIEPTSDTYLNLTPQITPVQGRPTNLYYSIRYDTEANWDGCVVEVSADGSTWTDVEPGFVSNGYNSTIEVNPASPISGRRAYSGSSGGFLDAQVDLTSLFGGASALSLRFRMATDEFVTGNGCFIDDVTVGDVPCLATTTIGTSNEFPAVTSNTLRTCLKEGAPGVILTTRVMLGGGVRAGGMTDSLAVTGVLPLAQPFNQAPWNYAGSESVTAFPASVSDWVLVEIRSASDARTYRAGFVTTTGDVVDLDGTSPILLDANPGDYEVIIHHRNHLSIVAPNTVSLSGTP